MYESVGSFDALVCAASNGYFGSLESMTDQDFRKSVNSKLTGQVNLVLIGQHYIKPARSFTLTSGSVALDQVPQTSSLSINAAVEGSVKGAAIEFKNDIRINVVCPIVVAESP